jgi:hypothetical protein
MSLTAGTSMMCDPELRLRLNRVQNRALVVGGAGLALCLAAWVVWPNHFFAPYLVGYLFWLGIALGSMGLTMLHHLAGGSWGLVIRRPLEAGGATVPLLAVLFLPIALGIPVLYPWARAEVGARLDTPLRVAYLNETLFLVRAAGYFGVWTALAFLLGGWSSRQDHISDHRPSGRLQALSGPGTVILFLAGTFSAVDWVMSLEAPWASTIFGAMLITGDAMATFAVMIAVAVFLASAKPMSEIATPGRLNDLGNLLLAFVMLWAYMSFCQFLIVWSGNLTEEIPWYLRRTRGGWEWLAIALIVCQFFLPFFLLLIRENKRHTRSLLGVTLLILVMHWVELIWLVIPASSDPAGPRIPWIEIPLCALTLAGVGGIWTAVFIGRLKSLPLVPLNDPTLNEALEKARGHDQHA